MQTSHINDALWAAAVFACPHGNPNRREACPPEAIVHKWQVLDDIRKAKERSAFPTARSRFSTLCFPSTRKLILTGGEPSSSSPRTRTWRSGRTAWPRTTLRRHLAALVELGLIIRRDSPNGKRYARKGEGGEIEEAFGFDLSPLVARAAEFQRLAAEAKAAEQVLRHLRDRITICRRDIDKMIATGIYEGRAGRLGCFPTPSRVSTGAFPEKRHLAMLKPLATALEGLAREIPHSSRNPCQNQ